MKPQLLALSLVLASLGCGTAMATPTGLDLDPTLNLLTFGNFTVNGSDVQGRVAVGGNASINSYSINSPYQYPGAALTVAGNLNFLGGSISGNTIVGGNFNSNYSGSVSGNVAVGGSLDASAGISANSVTTWGTVTGYQPWYAPDTAGVGPFNLGFNFATEKAQLTQLSTQLDLDANTGTATKPYSTLIFNASNSHGINIFDISAADAATSMQLTGLGAGGTVIINVHGSNVDFGSHGFTGFDSARGQVLFNLVDATNVEAGYVEGSILAPLAAFSGSGGVVWGQVVADSWSGNTQLNSAAFIGGLPAAPVGSVPEPESYALLLTGLGMLGAVLTRRRVRTAIAAL